MTENLDYGLWIWAHKLEGLLALLAALAQYELSDEEFEIIRSDLAGTNDEKGIWTEYPFHGKKYAMEIKMAYDAE